MSDLTIEAVSGKKQLVEFIQFPFSLYKGDPCWVPPLIEERLEFFDPAKNPFYEHSRVQHFLARSNGKVVGTIVGVIDDHYNSFHDEKMAGFGFLEAPDDPDIAAALFEAAENWGRAQGMTFIRGPLNFGTNQELGTLIDGPREPPFFMMTYNPPYYPSLIEREGYAKAKDLYAWIFDIEPAFKAAPEKFFKVGDRALKNAGLTIRKIDMKNYWKDVEVIKAAYNGAWERNWGFVPMTDHEVDHLARSLKPIMDPDIVFIAETADGTPAGLALNMPDIHQALRLSGGGRYWPLGLPRFMWHRRHIDQVRLMLVGVLPGYRGRGIDGACLLETARTTLQKGYKRLEGSWILEDNDDMNLIIERVGGRHYKTYRVYQKDL